MLISTLSYSYIYDIVIYTKLTPQNTAPQTIIGLADYHDKEHSANESQRSYLESFITRCCPKKHKLIIEDLSSVNNNGYGVCDGHIIYSNSGILGKLADVARSAHVEVDNIEYRYCRVAALGPLLKQAAITSSKEHVRSSISMQCLYREISNEIAIIDTYDDGAFLNGIYKKCIRKVQKSLSQLHFTPYLHESIADYCMTLCKKNYRKALEKLCIFDSSLIDSKIMHSIVSSPEKTLIIIIAGGSHIEKMGCLLQSLKYKKQAIPLGLQQKTSIHNSVHLPVSDLSLLDSLVFQNNQQ